MSCWKASLRLLTLIKVQSQLSTSLFHQVEHLMTISTIVSRQEHQHVNKSNLGVHRNRCFVRARGSTGDGALQLLHVSEFHAGSAASAVLSSCG